MKTMKILMAVVICSLLTQSEFDFLLWSGADITSDASGSRGSSWGDIDGDGDEDLFVSNRQDQNNLFYLNTTTDPERPSFEKVLEGAIVSDGGNSQGSGFADYDNDGDLDLFVANRGNQKNFLYRNRGNGDFEKITSGDVVNDEQSSTSVSWVDVNNDGFLDLFIANRNQEPNSLYINDGEGGFEKLGEGQIVEDLEDSRACVWADFDNDGDQDLLVGNARMPNSIYMNQGNLSFIKLGKGPHLNETGYTYGVSAQDIDNDGHVDLFIANLYEPNILYLNTGEGNFIKVSEGDITTDQGHSKGLVWQDFDNDGDLDLFVSNGIPGSVEDHFFYRNEANVEFSKIGHAAVTRHGGLAAGSSSADINNDGTMDLFVTNWVDNNNNKLFFNLTGKGEANWAQILLRGKKSPITPYGARATLHYSTHGKSYRFSQFLTSQSGYGSQSSHVLHFGIGESKKIDSLVVHWPSGMEQTFRDIELNKKQIIKETD